MTPAPLGEPHQRVAPEAKPASHRSLWQRLLLSLILIYQRRISPLTPPSCRFTPTCSTFAKEAISHHGGWLGGWMAWARIVRCHPFHPGGHDPVPHHAPHTCAVGPDAS